MTEEYNDFLFHLLDEMNEARCGQNVTEKDIAIIRAYRAIIVLMDIIKEKGE